MNTDKAYVIQSNSGFEYPGFDIAWMGDVSDRRPDNRFDERFFDSKEEAEEFLINKKPCLSYGDILDWGTNGHFDFFKLKEIIKSKLSIT